MTDESFNHSRGTQPISYDHGQFLIGGSPFFVIGAEYQYYRDQQNEWDQKLARIKAAGTNTITFYVPWRHHLIQATPQQFDFLGITAENRNLHGFIEAIADHDLLAIAKPGPFVHSELNIGGLPDMASPTFNSKIAPALDHEDRPVLWEYDGTMLPAPFAEPYLTLSREWLHAVGSVLRPQTFPSGPIIAIQLNDETLYCTSNSPPWAIGYEQSSIDAYLKETGTTLATVPREVPFAPKNRADERALLSWAKYQWWLRTDSYRRYRIFLDIDLPHFSNHAGITPPIEENVPREGGKPARLLEQQGHPAPDGARYADWWFQTNRIEADRNVYEYGFISWLGVAAYNIGDPATVRTDGSTIPNQVFNRYVNTVARGRGPNLEENWGFAKLYHPFSASPFVPFFQTLLSVAAGGTGYTVFCAVQHSYWDDSLDRMTKLQHPTFPSDAPIRSDGSTTPMYDTMTMLNRWLQVEGTRLLSADRWEDLRFGIQASASAIMGWTGARQQVDPPFFAGREIEELSFASQEAGYVPTLFGLEDVSATDYQPDDTPVVVLGGRRMGRSALAVLRNHLERGGTVIYGGNLPERDWEDKPVAPLKQHDRLLMLPDAAVTEPALFPRFLSDNGIHPRLPVDQGVRFFLYQSESESFIFFFKFTTEIVATTFDLGDVAIRFTTPGRAAGALAVAEGRVRSLLFKGVNEVEGTQATIAVTVSDGDGLTITGDELLLY